VVEVIAIPQWKDASDLLVWKASSILMNRVLGAERLERERRLDPERFVREYEAEFVDDLEGFLSRGWVDDAVVTGRRELPPLEDVEYHVACDPSGGDADAFTVCIVHTEGEDSERRVVQEVIKGWLRSGGKSVDLQGLVREIARTLKLYGLYAITGDKYSAGRVRQGFRAKEIDYEDAPE
jgi:hypothetical protein